jgi:hypothetical protein
MLIQLLKAGAALTVVMAVPAMAAPSQAQVLAGGTNQATARVAIVDKNITSGMITPPLPASGTWPILISGIGMIGFATRRRPLVA